MVLAVTAARLKSYGSQMSKYASLIDWNKLSLSLLKTVID